MQSKGSILRKAELAIHPMDGIVHSTFHTKMGLV